MRDSQDQKSSIRFRTFAVIAVAIILARAEVSKSEQPVRDVVGSRQNPALAAELIAPVVATT